MATLRAEEETGKIGGEFGEAFLAPWKVRGVFLAAFWTDHGASLTPKKDLASRRRPDRSNTLM
jgi:hypothetical protein